MPGIQRLRRTDGSRATGPGSRPGRRSGHGTLAIPAIPTISCINIRPATASAWPIPGDVVSRKHFFRPPHVTDRVAPKGLRRWRYFAHDLSSSSAKTASAPNSFFTATLAEADPGNRRRDQGRTRPAAPRDRADRVGKHRQPRGAGSAGLGDDQQICRRLSGRALLRRLRMGRRRRDAGDRARQETVRRAVRQRAAELRQPDEPGGVPGAAAARRHLHGPRPRRRRPSHPRLARQHVRQMVQGRALHGAPRGPDHRHGRGREAGRAGEAEADHRRRIGLFARLGFQALPRDRRQRRRLSAGRHGAFRRPRRRRRACLAGAACACHHHHHAQIAARPARRPDPVQRRGARQEVQFGDLPGPAGRSADACDRRQGGGLRRGAAAGLQDLRQERGRERQGAGGSAARATASISSPAAPTTI